MKPLLALIFGVFLSSISLGQSKFSIGIQGGFSRLNTFASSPSTELPEFSPESTISGIGQIYGKYTLGQDWFARLGFGLMHFGISTSLEGIRGNVSSLGGQTLNPQVVTTFGKEIKFGKSGWGAYLAAGVSLTNFNLEGSRIYSLSSEEGITFQGVIIRNDLGDVSEVLAHDMRVFNTRDKNLWHIRPEVGLFKLLGRSRLSAAFIYGHKLGEDLYSISYNSISYFDQNYTESHGTSGSFTSFQLGYEFTF